MARKKDITTLPRDPYVEAIEARRAKQLNDDDAVEAKIVTEETNSKEVKAKGGK